VERNQAAGLGVMFISCGCATIKRESKEIAFLAGSRVLSVRKVAKVTARRSCFVVISVREENHFAPKSGSFRSSPPARV